VQEHLTGKGVVLRVKVGDRSRELEDVLARGQAHEQALDRLAMVVVGDLPSRQGERR
jgi:hypothetical protein